MDAKSRERLAVVSSRKNRYVLTYCSRFLSLSSLPLSLAERRDQSAPESPTLGGLGAGAHALVGTVDLLALHADVLQPPVVRVDAVLQQLAQGHRAAGKWQVTPHPRTPLQAGTEPLSQS